MTSEEIKAIARNEAEKALKAVAKNAALLSYETYKKIRAQEGNSLATEAELKKMGYSVDEINKAWQKWSNDDANFPAAKQYRR